MEVQKLSLSRLRNEAYHQFLTDFDVLVVKHTATTLGIEVLFTEFTPLFVSFGEGLKLVHASTHTQKVTEADFIRDETYRSLYNIVKAYCGHYEAPVRDAALRLRLVFDNFGDVTVLPYDQETATINTLLGVLTTTASNDVSLLGLTAWISVFAEQNTAFNNLVQMRYNENAGKTQVDLKETRKNLDALYKSMVKRITSLIEVNGAAAYAGFVTDLNLRIAHYRQLQAVRHGRNENGETPESPQA